MRRKPISLLVTFELDPIFGEYGPNPVEVATWDLHVTQVPAPASAFVLLSGVIGIGLSYRKKYCHFVA